MEMQSSHKRVQQHLDRSAVRPESEYESANITVIEDEDVTKYSRLGVTEKQYQPITTLNIGGCVPPQWWMWPLSQRQTIAKHL